MLGFQPGIFWKVCWMLVGPTFLIVGLKNNKNNEQNISLKEGVIPYHISSTKNLEL